MTATFVQPLVLPDDLGGFGFWLTEHYYEHQRFMLTLRNATPRVDVPDYDILAWIPEPEAVKSWLFAHNQMHLELRSATGLTGIDLQTVDFSKPSDFLIWMDAHATEHQILAQLLGDN